MIKLTQLSGRQAWVNPDLLESMESTPDTMLVLVGGHRIMVRESPQQVVDLLRDYRAEVLARAGDALAAFRQPGSAAAAAGQAVHADASRDARAARRQQGERA